VIFIGAVVDWAADALEFGAGVGLPPHAAVSTTTDHPAPITDRRAAMFTVVILNTQAESKLNALVAVDPTGAICVLQFPQRRFRQVAPRGCGLRARGHCQLEQFEGDFRPFACLIDQVACDI
jgi:hypothetical protein